eukprot:scaffold4187_cov57-Phaeocystis_antarctica.AAC.7
MRAFDCMRRVRAREVVARAYGDAGIRCADRTARRRACAGSGSARGRRAGSGAPELHWGRAQVGRHALQARGSRLEVHPPLPWRTRRDQVAAPQPLAAQPQAGRRPPSAQGLLGGSGGCDAAGAAAAELAARHSRRRWREFPVVSAAPVGAAPWTGSPGSGEMPTEAPAWLRQPRASQRAGACTGPSSWPCQESLAPNGVEGDDKGAALKRGDPNWCGRASSIGSIHGRSR